MTNSDLIQGLAKSLVVESKDGGGTLKMNESDVSEGMQAHGMESIILGLPDYSLSDQVLMSRILTVMDYAQDKGMTVSIPSIKDYFQSVHDASILISENTGVAADAIRSSLYRHPARFYGASIDEVNAFIEVYSGAIAESTTLVVSDENHDGVLDMVYFLSQGHEKGHPSGQVMKNFEDLMEFRDIIHENAKTIHALSISLLESMIANPKTTVLKNMVSKLYPLPDGNVDHDLSEFQKSSFVDNFMFSMNDDYADNLAIALSMYANELGKQAMIIMEGSPHDDDHSILGQAAFSSNFKKAIKQSIQRLPELNEEYLGSLYVNLFKSSVNEARKVNPKNHVKSIPAEKGFLIECIVSDLQKTIGLLCESIGTIQLKSLDVRTVLHNVQSKTIMQHDLSLNHVAEPN